jgi:hypothetical protein
LFLSFGIKTNTMVFSLVFISFFCSIFELYVLDSTYQLNIFVVLFVLIQSSLEWLVFA